jgi:hypothetical protein
MSDLQDWADDLMAQCGLMEEDDVREEKPSPYRIAPMPDPQHGPAKVWGVE